MTEMFGGKQASLRRDPLSSRCSGARPPGLLSAVDGLGSQPADSSPACLHPCSEPTLRACRAGLWSGLTGQGACRPSECQIRFTMACGGQGALPSGCGASAGHSCDGEILNHFCMHILYHCTIQLH